MKQSKTRWKKPKGYTAIQTYVPKETYEALQVMRKKHDRSLRAEIRRIIIEAVEEWKIRESEA